MEDAESRGVIGLGFLLVVQGFGAVGMVLAPWVWLADLTNHFAVWLGVCALAGVLHCLQLRSWRWLGLFAVLSLGHGVRLFAHTWPSGPAGSRTLTVVLANVYTGNTETQRVLDYIAAVEPDVVGLLEVDQDWLDALGPLRATYPTHFEKARSDNFGVALYGHGLTNLRHETLGITPVPSVFADHPAGIELLLTHPLPPVGTDYARRRDAQLHAISGVAHAQLVLLGDLNATPWSAHFPSGLSPQVWTAGTWPAHVPAPLRIPIDHVLVGSGVRVLSRKVGPDVGSDHRPVEVVIAVP